MNFVNDLVCLCIQRFSPHIMKRLTQVGKVAPDVRRSKHWYCQAAQRCSSSTPAERGGSTALHTTAEAVAATAATALAAKGRSERSECC
eukprot:SAG11_NODE_2099_length_3827_cov_1.669796_4_plen_89_part_00